MNHSFFARILMGLLYFGFLSSLSMAQEAVRPVNPNFDEALAKSLSADELGMRKYVLVILRTGPQKMPKGPERDEMFKGHFANMNRLAEEGKLALAGPFMDPLNEANDWRGLFVFATESVEDAKSYTATDPVIIKGEMVAEYHKLYASAALMLVRDAHNKLAKKSF